MITKQLTKRLLAIQAQHGRKEMLSEIARGGIEQCVEFGEDADADTIFDDCYCAAFDALIDHGIPITEAREAARLEAKLFAQA
jgi:hypothetical protein